MASTAKNEELMAKAILTTFAQYGFQKTSMEDIARSAGLSRQSIYKKFGSKEQCYKRVINVYLAAMYREIFTVLSNGHQDPLSTLLKVFDISTGEAIDIVSHSHGTAVMDNVLNETWKSEEDWPLRYRARLAEFLEYHCYASNANADGIAFTLICAAKGLLLEESSREKLLEQMTLIIESLSKGKN
ncbi:TetR/AcrR family transcriptional regulator [bacterium SCSIO 12696]|nr:TetR/AcrR family transcriptional regulator [bacterium SCSIO 12696]